MKQTFLFLACITLVNKGTFAQAGTAVPFSCSEDIYSTVEIPTRLIKYNLNTNPVSLTYIGNPAAFSPDTPSYNGVNAVGYNVKDNFIYGLRGAYDPVNGVNKRANLVRIDAAGNFFDLGTVSGLATTAGYTTGEFDTSGNFYVKLAGNNTNLYKIDVAAMTAQMIPLSDRFSVTDLAFAPTDGLLWGINNDTDSAYVFSVNPSTGSVNFLNSISHSYRSYGALFGSLDGNIYALGSDSNFVKLNTSDGSIDTIGKGIPSANLDGATCLLSINALPVDLLSFRVSVNNNRPLLIWATAKEVNNQGFGVESSMDGKHWSSIAFIPSKADNGNSIFPLEYAYEDPNLFNGYKYYRLKQLDFDGQYAYSPVRMVKLATDVFVSVYPNPAQYSFTINGLSGDEHIYLLELSGRIIQQIKPEAVEATMDISGLSDGVYLLKISSGNKNQIRKIIKLKD